MTLRIFPLLLLLTICFPSYSDAQTTTPPVIMKNAQQREVQTVPVNDPVRKTPVARLESPIAAGPQLVEGKDLRIVIDQWNDLSVFDLNKYAVQFTVTNWGKTEIVMPQYIGVQGIFYTESGGYYESAGMVKLTNAGSVLRSGQSVQGRMDIEAPYLRTNTPYKFNLVVDGDQKISESDENNNSAEKLIVARAIKNSDYFLSSATITIHTGSDNKEADNSQVYVYLGLSNYNESSFFSVGDWRKGTGYAPEMKVNSATNITLGGNTVNTYPYNNLCFYKQKGVALTIVYNNKAWATDAWKISAITMTLHFTDKNGNPYPDPAYASRTISFPNLSAVLGYRPGDDITSNARQQRVLTIGTDQNFIPLPPEYSMLNAGNGFNTLTLRNSSTYNKPIVYCK